MVTTTTDKIAFQSKTVHPQTYSTWLTPADRQYQQEHCHLDVTQWPSYTNSTWRFWRRTCLPRVNFLRQDVQKSKHLQTDEHTNICDHNITTSRCIHGW